MSGQLHITHRAAFLRGLGDGKRDALAGDGYRPRDGAGDTNDQRAYGLGYEGGWAEADPCTNGTCGHPAHRVFRFAVYERGEVVARDLNLADAEAMAGRLAAEDRNVYLALDTDA
jgi:hypothetical protein